MDHKIKKIEETMLAAYGLPVLSGAVAGDEAGIDEGAAAADGGGVVVTGPVALPHVADKGLAARIARMSRTAQLDITEMSAIMAGHPIVAYISNDDQAAGIICTREWMRDNWDTYCRFGQCFWRSQQEICTEFNDELRRVGRNYGR
jgi:hypothetical protein